MTKNGSLAEYDQLADRIRLHRRTDKRPVVIVEGPTDVAFLENCVPLDCSYFPAGTRSLALKAATGLHEFEMRRYTCIVDRDFDDTVAQYEKSGARVFAYENADLEAMLSTTKPFTIFLEALASREKLGRRGGANAVLSEIQDIVRPLTLLRRANSELGWGLRFDEVDVAGKIDRRTLKLQLQSYCAALSETVSGNPSQGVLLAYATGQQQTAMAPECPRGSSPYYRGRDLLAAVGVALRNAIGSCDRGVANAEHLAKVLRLTAAGYLADHPWMQDLVEALS